MRCSGAAAVLWVFLLLDVPDWVLPRGLDLQVGVGPCLVKKGHINLGVLLNIKSDDTSDLSWFSLAITEAARWVVEEINRSRLLKDLRLGYVILDHGVMERGALANALHFLPASQPPSDVINETACLHSFKHFEVMGLVTTGSSPQTTMTASVAGLTALPTVAAMASSDDLSNRERFDSLVRLVPPDRFQSQAMVDLLFYFNWTYVSVIYSSGTYGENGATHLEHELAERSICIAYMQRIDEMSPKEIYFTAIQRIVQSSANVVILFLDYENGVNFFSAVNDLGMATAKVWLASDAITYMDHIPAMSGMLSVNFVDGNASEFLKYYNKMTPSSISDNPWMREYWESTYNCSWNESPNCLDFNFSPPTMSNTDTFVSKVLDAIYTQAYAFHEFIHHQCPSAIRYYSHLYPCFADADLFPYLSNVSFVGYSGSISFNRKGDLLGGYTFTQYIHGKGKPNTVASWAKTEEGIIVYEDQFNWDVYKNNKEDIISHAKVVKSVCSLPCGAKKYYRMMEQPCCWQCESCRDNEIIINKTGCAACKNNTWPDEQTALFCKPIPPTNLHWTDEIAIAELCIAAVGFLTTISVAVLGLINRNNPLIKASSKELSVLIIIGIAIAFATVPLFVAPPTQWTCLCQKYGFDLAVCLIFAPLLVRTIRIQRIFAASRKGIRRPPFISNQVQIGFVACLVMIQLILSIIVTFVARTTVELRMPVPNSKFVERVCQMPLEGFVLPLAYNLLLALLAAAFGFLTRKLPENFNESWYIFVCVSTTAFIWAVFLPTYFTTFYASGRAALLGFCLILNAYISLFCLYFPKLYAIYFLHENLYCINNCATKTSHNIQHVEDEKKDIFATTNSLAQ